MFHGVIRENARHIHSLKGDCNSLFRKILPITPYESIFCRKNQSLADDKFFASKILSNEIRKKPSLRSARIAGPLFLSAESAFSQSFVALGKASHEPRFDTTECLT